MDHLTTATSPTKSLLELSSGDTVDIEIKEIGRKRIHSRDSSNSHFKQAFYCASKFIDSTESYACRRNTPMTYLDQSVLRSNL